MFTTESLLLIPSYDEICAELLKNTEFFVANNQAVYNSYQVFFNGLIAPLKQTWLLPEACVTELKKHIEHEKKFWDALPEAVQQFIKNAEEVLAGNFIPSQKTEQTTARQTAYVSVTTVRETLQTLTIQDHNTNYSQYIDVDQLCKQQRSEFFSKPEYLHTVNTQTNFSSYTYTATTTSTATVTTDPTATYTPDANLKSTPYNVGGYYRGLRQFGPVNDKMSLVQKIYAHSGLSPVLTSRVKLLILDCYSLEQVINKNLLPDYGQDLATILKNIQESIAYLGSNLYVMSPYEMLTELEKQNREDEISSLTIFHEEQKKPKKSEELEKAEELERQKKQKAVYFDFIDKKSDAILKTLNLFEQPNDRCGGILNQGPQTIPMIVEHYRKTLQAFFATAARLDPSPNPNAKFFDPIPSW